MSEDSDLLNAVRPIARQLEADLSRLAPRAGHEREEELYRQVAAALDRCLGQLAVLKAWGPQNRLASSELWNRCESWLARGWLQNRARTKPRGYAGDYELLSRIYRGERCDDSLGRLFDHYFHEQAAPRAVRHRMTMMANWIAAAVRTAAADPEADQSPLRVAVVGSAFGLEARDALGQLTADERRRVHLTLLDLDPAALEFAAQQLQPLLAPRQLAAVSTNVFRLPGRSAVAAILRDCRLLLCPGLFDYLDDAAAREMLAALYAQLAPGGRLTVFQFAPHNPSRAYMEWLANWYLIYRDAAQFRQVVAQAGLSGQVAAAGAEPLGVDLFLTLERR
jgi:hypothetical protein